jgi:hypothetical protein
MVLSADPWPNFQATEGHLTNMSYFCAIGEMAEWSNAAVLKTVVRLRGPGVRIPLSPQTSYNRTPVRFFCGLVQR